MKHYVLMPGSASKNYDRIDAYAGTEHSPNSKLAHDGVPVQRDVVTSRTEPPASPGHTSPVVRPRS
jgi:hypothetical protein